MQFQEPKEITKCLGCGKVIPARNKRNKTNYCSRVCSGLSRYSLRYQGTNAGPFDRPESMKDKTKWESTT